MEPILSFVSPEELKILASRSNLRYGLSIADNGIITISKINTFNIEGVIKYGNKNEERTELHSTVKGLRWKCTCTSKKGLFCEHCVALGTHVFQKNKQEKEGL